jgi:heavy metal efflux system protein
VVVGGMLVGPILLLLVVPALQALFLGGGEPSESPAEEAETV